MSACSGRLSVLSECVHCSVSLCACSTGGHVHMYIQTVYQDRNYNKTQPVFRVLDVLASRCRIHVLQNTLKMTVSCLDAYPIIHAALKIAVVSCSTHQQLFKQQLAPSNVTGEAFTSCPQTKQHNNEDATSAYAAREGRRRTLSCCRWYSAHSVHGGEQFHMLRSSKFGHIQG